jgi:hypothetical protein
MRSRYLKVIAVVIVASLLFQFYPFLTSMAQSQESPSHRDLHEGIVQIKEAIRRLDEAIAQELDDANVFTYKLLKSLVIDILKGYATENHRKALSLWERIDHTRELNKALQERDWTGLSQSAKALSLVLEEALSKSKDPRKKALGIALKGSRKGTEYGIKVVGMLAARKRVEQLRQIRDSLEKQLAKLQNKNVEVIRAEWERIFQNLYREPIGDLRSFLNELAQEGVDLDEIAKGVMQDAVSISTTTLFQATKGLTLVDQHQDIWDLRKIPGINPDFIAALERCRKVEFTYWDEVSIYSQTGSPSAALRARQAADDIMTCNKYSDGSYIHAFGPRRGTSGSNVVSGTQPRYPTNPSNDQPNRDTNPSVTPGRVQNEGMLGSVSRNTHTALSSDFSEERKNIMSPWKAISGWPLLEFRVKCVDMSAYRDPSHMANWYVEFRNRYPKTIHFDFEGLTLQGSQPELTWSYHLESNESSGILMISKSDATPCGREIAVWVRVNKLGDN